MKRIMNRIAATILAFMWTFSVAHAAGTSGAQFLKLGAGAQAAAMGDAFTSVANDVTAAYWNPAGIKQIEETQIAVMQNNYLVDTSYQYLGVALPLRNSALAFSLYRMDYGDIDGYNASDVKTGSFDASSLAGAVTLAKDLTDRTQLGLTGKFIQESIENESASGFAADVGMKTKVKRLDVGLTLQHLGSSMKFVEASESLPITFRAGASTRFFNEKFLVAVDLSKPRDNDASIHLGTEYMVREIFFIRAGYFNTPGNSLDVGGSTGLTGGIGVNYRRFAIDYAFVPFGDLDTTHRISLKIKFANKK